MSAEEANDIFPQTFKSNLMKSGLRSLKQSSKYPLKFSSNFSSIQEKQQLNDSYALPKKHNKSVLNNLNKLSRQKQSKYSALISRLQQKSIFNQNHDLNEIEDIIDDIQNILTKIEKPVNLILKNNQNINLQKKKWHGKDITNKFNVNSVDRLQQLLFSYSTTAQISQLMPLELPLNFKKQYQKPINRKIKIAQIKQYHKIQEDLKETKRRKKGFSQNLQIIQIDWMKLPIIPLPIKISKIKKFTNIQNYPSSQQYQEIFTQKPLQIKKYLLNSYSVFSKNGGLNQNNMLLSEEQFRQAWKENSQVTNFNENQQQLLLQFELEWFYCIVQNCYNNSIQDIILKNISYNPEIFRQFMNDLVQQRQQQTKKSIYLNKYKFLHQWILIKQPQKLTFFLIREMQDNQNIYSQQIQSFFTTFKYQLSKATNELQSNQIMIVAITTQNVQKYNITQFDNTIIVKDLFKFYVNEEPYPKDQYICVQKQNNSFNLNILLCENSNERKLLAKQELFFGNKFK